MAWADTSARASRPLRDINPLLFSGNFAEL
jgi:hypothetical protein